MNTENARLPNKQPERRYAVKKHILSAIDRTSKTAVCAHCGLVRLWFKRELPVCSLASGRRAKAWRKKNPERIKAYEATYLAADPRRHIRQLWSNMKVASRRFGYAPIAGNREDFVVWYEAQEKKCMWCGGAHRLSVDHDHETGQLRGLKCMACNVLEGQITKHGGIKYLNAVYNGYCAQEVGHDQLAQS